MQFHSQIDTLKLEAPNGKAFHVSLPEVYIPIETANPFHQTQEDKLMRDAEAGSGKENKQTEPPFIDIEKLMGRKNCLLLQGPEGMGKTTLIKHLAHTIIQGIGEGLLSGYLPIVILLKDLWPIYERELPAPSAGVAVTFETLLASYLKTYAAGLTLELVEQYCIRDRALFLIDGLDEVPAHSRGSIVEMVAIYRLKHLNNRFLLTGRTHGIDSAVRKHFGSYLHCIEPLDDAKIKEFINKWFHIVSGQAVGAAAVTYGEMIADIKGSEYVTVFTQNPLLLTAVCIFYQDNKRLPDQRADLYTRIVDNLLHRRFHHLPQAQAAGIENYLKQLAFHMQERNLKKIDVGEARDILKEFFPADNEKPQVYNGRIHDFFEEIEPCCGLLKRSGEGEIEFFYLTFQDFLAARHMQYAEIDYIKYLEKYWWEETILFYTGLFVREYKDKANRLAGEILNYSHTDERSLRRLWLLGAKSLREIQAYKRDVTVLAAAQAKLLEIIESKASLKDRFEAGEILGHLGDPRIDVFNPSMVRIEAGEFIMGAEESAREEPVRQIYLDEFMIGKYPITNQEFRMFINDKGYETKECWTPEGWQWRQKENISKPLYWHDYKWNGPNFPVVGVSWYEASAYANWLTKKTGNRYCLPTEAQWEKAARGSRGFQYPWGNEFDKNKCNSYESGLGRTSPVGIFPGGKSPYGCLDMAGNVWEYAGDYYKKRPGKNPQLFADGSDRVIRGGSWFLEAGFCWAACRRGFRPIFRVNNVGFRLLRSL